MWFDQMPNAGDILTILLLFGIFCSIRRLGTNFRRTATCISTKGPLAMLWAQVVPLAPVWFSNMALMHHCRLFQNTISMLSRFKRDWNFFSLCQHTTSESFELAFVAFFPFVFFFFFRFPLVFLTPRFFIVKIECDFSAIYI